MLLCSHEVCVRLQQNGIKPKRIVTELHPLPATSHVTEDLGERSTEVLGFVVS